MSTNLSQAEAIDGPAAKRTTVATTHASRYLQQLCKHFAHKRAVVYDESKGEIEFSAGVCELAADEKALRIIVRASDAKDIETLVNVVQSHLARFAFREDLTFEWESSTSR